VPVEADCGNARVQVSDFGSPSSSGARAAILLAGGAVTRRVRVAATCGSRSGARAATARGRCAPDQSAQRVIVLAGHASLPQQLGVNGAEHRSVPGVGHCDLDLHQARSVHDDALQRLMFPNERDELAFVKGPHLVEPTGERSCGRTARGRPVLPRKRVLLRAARSGGGGYWTACAWSIARASATQARATASAANR
jgi:hypothetical protein